MKFIFKHLNKIVAAIFILGALYSVALIAGAGWLVKYVASN